MNWFEEQTAKWIRRHIPEVIPIYYDICEKPFNHYLELNEKQVYFPDFALISKYTLRKVCWVEVKATQSLDEEGKDFEWIQEKKVDWYLWNRFIQSKLWYNLNTEKHENYNIIAKLSGLPVFLIVFSGGKKYWGRIDIFKPELENVYYKPVYYKPKRTSRNLIPVSDNLSLLIKIIKVLVKIDKKQEFQKLRKQI